mgnify:CR=1 FL=1
MNQPQNENKPSLELEMRGNEDSTHVARKSVRVAYNSTIKACSFQRESGELITIAVQCKAISKTGIAFYTKVIPEGKQIVLMLSSGGKEIEIAARIAYVNRVDERQHYYQVGCEFISKIDPAKK